MTKLRNTAALGRVKSFLPLEKSDHGARSCSSFAFASTARSAVTLLSNFSSTSSRDLGGSGRSGAPVAGVRSSESCSRVCTVQLGKAARWLARFSQAHRFRVRFPAKLIVGNSFQCLAGVSDFLIEFRQQRFVHCHSYFLHAEDLGSLHPWTSKRSKKIHRIPAAGPGERSASLRANAHVLHQRKGHAERHYKSAL